jgi:SAM-dependent methyltransferase
MNIQLLKGLRYPSETVIRMFYKENLDKLINGNVLELGCGTANHLMHFAAYGWNFTGLDYSFESLAMAKHNLESSGYEGQLVLHDLIYPLPFFENQFDVLLAPSSLYYLSRETSVSRLKEASLNLKIDGLVFLQMRLPDDHRYARGYLAGNASWTLNCEYTGEAGLLNVFWTEYELIELMKDIFHIPFSKLTVLRQTYENRQGSMTVRNSDIVLWGRKGE